MYGMKTLSHKKDDFFHGVPAKLLLCFKSNSRFCVHKNVSKQGCHDPMEHCWDSGAGHQGEHDVVQQRAHQGGPGGAGITAAEEVSTSVITNSVFNGDLK